MLTRGKTIASIFDLWEKEKFVCLVTEEIILEITQVIERFIVRKLISPKDGFALIRRLKTNTKLVISFSQITLSPDKKDNRYLACAVDGEADYLVTGDKKHLLPLRKIANTKIISPQGILKAFLVEERIVTYSYGGNPIYQKRSVFDVGFRPSGKLSQNFKSPPARGSQR